MFLLDSSIEIFPIFILKSATSSSLSNFNDIADIVFPTYSFNGIVTVFHLFAVPSATFKNTKFD